MRKSIALLLGLSLATLTACGQTPGNSGAASSDSASAVISEAASDAAPATAETPAASSRDTTTEQRNVLDGFVDFSAGHELYAVFFTVIFFRNICHGKILGEKLLGKGRKLHSGQNTRGHHGFEGFILAAKIFGKISGQLDTQLTVQTEIGFIGVHYQHLFPHARQFFCKERRHGAFSAATLAAYGYFHQNSSHVLRIPKIASS